MLQFVAYGVASLVATKRPCELKKLEGYWRGSDGWLQLFDARALPANGTVPIYSLFVQGSFIFSSIFDAGKAFSQGMVIAFSSTEATLTVQTGGGSNLGDIEGEAIQIPYTEPTVTSASATDNLDVWTDANGPQKLVGVTFVNGDAATRYLMVFGTSSAADGDTPIREWSAAASSTLTLFFGQAGIDLMQMTTAHAIQDGCFLVVSTTPKILTASGSGTHTLTALSFDPVP